MSEQTRQMETLINDLQYQVRELQGKLHQAVLETGIYLEALREVLDGVSTWDLEYDGFSREDAQRLTRLAGEGATGADIEAADAALRAKNPRLRYPALPSAAEAKQQ